jgi:hypothetical protein
MPLLPFIGQTFFTNSLSTTTAFFITFRYLSGLRINYLAQPQSSTVRKPTRSLSPNSSTIMSSPTPTCNRKSLSFLVNT